MSMRNRLPSYIAALLFIVMSVSIPFPCLAGDKMIDDGVGSAPCGENSGADEVLPATTIKKIVLDPGHGGQDSGAVGYMGMKEKDINLTLALALEDRLKSVFCCEVMLTRRDDVFVSLTDRTEMANAWGANFYFSLHSNASPAGGDKGKVRGYEDYIYNGPVTAEEEEIRQVVHSYTSKVWQEAGSKNRGMKRANFHVLRETEMPSLLVENGFIDNEGDATLLQSSSFREKLVVAMANGIGVALDLPPAVAISVSIEGEIFYLPEGGSADLEAAVYPANASYREIAWSSDHPEIAAVDGKGRVEAAGRGETFIRVAVDGNRATNACGVVVGLEVRRGDPNGDGRIDVHDAILLLRHTVKLASLSPSQLYAGDLDGDRYVNIRDAIRILRHIVGLEVIPGEPGVDN
ncbi:MAG: hypothetical protein GX887_04760 [Firmicutes bacterium]|nr:hypothetical protein [Bacillota bacterium]